MYGISKVASQIWICHLNEHRWQSLSRFGFLMSSTSEVSYHTDRIFCIQSDSVDDWLCRARLNTTLINLHLLSGFDMKENKLTTTNLLFWLCRAPCWLGADGVREEESSGWVSVAQIAFGIRVWFRLVQSGLDMLCSGPQSVTKIVPRSCIVFEHPLVVLYCAPAHTQTLRITSVHS